MKTKCSICGKITLNHFRNSSPYIKLMWNKHRIHICNKCKMQLYLNKLTEFKNQQLKGGIKQNGKVIRSS